MDDAAVIDNWLAALLRDEVASPPARWRTHGVPAALVAERVDFHGVAHALAKPLTQLAGLSPELAAQLRQQAMMREYWEESHRQALVPVLEALAARGVPAALMKGTALAYLLYPQPASRTRGDTDLLVREEQLPTTRTILGQAGWQRRRPIHGVLFQETWQVQVAGGLVHDIDLHWRANDSALLQAALDNEAILARAIGVPRLAPAALAVANPWAMILAVLNAQYHSRFGYIVDDRRIKGPLRLVWALDMALLAGAMDAADWEALLRLARDGGIAAAIHDNLRAADGLVGLTLPSGVFDELASLPRETPAMEYLLRAKRGARLLADFRATSGFGAKIGLAAELLTPPEEHLRERFPQAGNWPVGALYVRYGLANLMRVLRG